LCGENWRAMKKAGEATTEKGKKKTWKTTDPST
jgi:hypothetical protein